MKDDHFQRYFCVFVTQFYHLISCNSQTTEQMTMIRQPFYYYFDRNMKYILKFRRRTIKLSSKFVLNSRLNCAGSSSIPFTFIFKNDISHTHKDHVEKYGNWNKSYSCFKEKILFAKFLWKQLFLFLKFDKNVFYLIELSWNWY